MSIITTWVRAEDGSVVEGDVRFYPRNDGTYDIESTTHNAGFTLGRDKVTKVYTVILKIEDNPLMRRLKPHVAIGDILISINDRLVIDESYEEICNIFDMLIKGSFPRRLKFLNPKKCPLQLYLKRMDIEQNVRTDLLGFNCTFEYLEYEKTLHAAQMHLTSQRDVEWVGYLKSIGGPENLKPAGVFKPSPDLKAIVRRGIPVAYRASVWQKISLSSLLRSQFPATYYKDLLAKVASGQLDKKVMDEIEKDLDRTFPQHNYFEPSGAGESGLRRVLQAFAVHNPVIGYCQSLNFLTGMMLIFMQEEDVFWLLITVVERLLPEDYYTKNMVGTYVDQYVLAHIIKKCLPRVNAAFEKHNLQLPLITVQWFMCVFVNTLRPEVALRVWDIFLNEGGKVLFRIAAALFQLNEVKLLAAKDASDLFSLLRNMGKDVVDADALIALAYKGYAPRPILSKMQTSPAQSSSSKKGAAESNGSTRSGRSMSAGLSHEVMNPRLKTRYYKFQGAVPADLIGIGLAHMGPDANPNTPIPRTDAYAENAAYLEAVGTIGEPGPGRASFAGSNMDVSVGAGSSKSTAQAAAQAAQAMEAVTSVGMGLDLTMPIGAVKDSTTAAIFRSPSKTDRNSRDRNSLSGSDRMSGSGSGSGVGSRPRTVRQFTPLQVSSDQLSYEAYLALYPQKAHGTGQRRSGKKKVLNFQRGDIALWRSSFRPPLELQYQAMEEARTEWRQEAQQNTRYDEPMRRASNSGVSGLAAKLAVAGVTSSNGAVSPHSNVSGVQGTASSASGVNVSSDSVINSTSVSPLTPVEAN